MQNQSKLAAILAITEIICSWLITIIAGVLSLILLPKLPLQSCLLGFIAIIICPTLRIPSQIKVILLTVGLLILRV